MDGQTDTTGLKDDIESERNNFGLDPNQKAQLAAKTDDKAYKAVTDFLTPARGLKKRAEDIIAAKTKSDTAVNTKFNGKDAQGQPLKGTIQYYENGANTALQDVNNINDVLQGRKTPGEAQAIANKALDQQVKEEHPEFEQRLRSLMEATSLQSRIRRK